jgi:hypothetical protein
MATPEPQRSTQDSPDHEAPGGQVVPVGAARTEVACRWIGWHVAELGGIGIPLVLAVTVSAWFTAVAVLVALAWAVHEYRTHHATTHERGEQA